MKTLLFKSEKYPLQAIEITQHDNELYSLPAASVDIPEHQNMFVSISEIEEVLNDNLTLILPVSR